LGLGLMVLAFLMDWAKVGAVVRRDPVFFAALGLFFVYLLLATVRGNYEFPQMDDRDAMVEWLSLSLFVCVAWWLRGDSRRMLTVISLAFAGFVIGILWNWNGEVTARVLGGDRDGFGRAIPVSALYSATAVLGLLVLAARFWGSHVPRWMFVSKIVVWGALLALMLQLLITTQSRITWIAALVVFPIVLLARLGATVRHRMSLRVIVPLSLLAFGVVAVVIYRNIDTLSLRVNYENQAWAGVARWDLDEIPIETAVGARAHLWYYGAGRWMERPLFGWGPSTQVTRLATSPISQYSHLHNTYLEILVRFGLVGAVLLMVLLFLIVRSVWRARQRGALPCAAAGRGVLHAPAVERNLAGTVVAQLDEVAAQRGAGVAAAAVDLAHHHLGLRRRSPQQHYRQPAGRPSRPVRPHPQSPSKASAADAWKGAKVSADCFRRMTRREGAMLP